MTPTTADARLTTEAETRGLLLDLAENPEVRRAIDLMSRVHARGQEDGAWDSNTGRRFESAWGYLRMAVEAADIAGAGR